MPLKDVSFFFVYMFEGFCVFEDVHGEVTSFVSLPSAEEIRKELLRKKKEELLKRYTEDTPEARLLAAHDNLTTAREAKENAV